MEDDVGSQPPDLRDRLLAVRGFGEHIDPGGGFDDHAKPAAEQVLVVGDNDGRHAFAPVGTTATTR